MLPLACHPGRERAETAAGTGSRVVLQVCDVLEMEDGHVSTLRSYYDAATLMVQLAVVPGAVPVGTPN